MNYVCGFSLPTCLCLISFFFFFFNDTAPTEISPLPLHDALPISQLLDAEIDDFPDRLVRAAGVNGERAGVAIRDRKSTRLNSSHANISYAVFCLKKKKDKQKNRH